MKNDTCLILMPHGSKDPQWTGPFRKLSDDLRKEMGPDAVYLAFMEIAAPSLMQVAAEVMKTSVRKCRVLPMFMAKGSHYNEDIPVLIAEMERAFPELKGELLEPIGLHPLFFQLMGNVIKSL